MSEKIKFSDRLQKLAETPTPTGRFVNAGISFLTAILALQAADKFNDFGRETLATARPLLEKSTEILYSSQSLNMQQLDVISAMQHNIGLLLGQVEVSGVAFWALSGLSVIALVQTLYNGAQAGIDIVKRSQNQDLP